MLLEVGLSLRSVRLLNMVIWYLFIWRLLRDDLYLIGNPVIHLTSTQRTIPLNNEPVLEAFAVKGTRHLKFVIDSARFSPSKRLEQYPYPTVIVVSCQALRRETDSMKTLRF